MTTRTSPATANAAPLSVLAMFSVGWSLLRQLTRPMTTVLIVMQGAFALAVIVAGQPIVATPVLSPLAVVAAIAALACWYAHAVGTNDLTDAVTDRINLRHTSAETERPLVNGSVGVRGLRRFTWLLAAVTVIATLIVDLRLWPALLGMFALNLAYSVRPVRLAGRGGLAQLVLPLGYVVVPAIFAWALADFAPLRPGALLSLAGLFVLFAGRLMLKDLRDVRGDRIVGKRTFLVRHGVTSTVRVAGACLGAGAVIMLTGVSWLATPVVTPLVLAVVLVPGTCGVVAVLRRIAVARIEDQVRLAAVVGRIGTGWLLCCLLAVTQPAGSAGGEFALLVAISAAMFALSTRAILPRAAR